DPAMSEDEIAANQIKLLWAGVVGEPGAVEPQSSPELQRIFFDIIARSADTTVANGTPLTYQWRFDDAEPWHIVVANGSTRAEPGEAPGAAVTFETRWADRVLATRPGMSPVKSILRRRIRPRGRLREIARMRRVFPG